jgi:hypothetical protein
MEPRPGTYSASALPLSYNPTPKKGAIQKLLEKINWSILKGEKQILELTTANERQGSD